jgi:hypothetical protein
MKNRENLFIKRIIDAIKNDEFYDKLIKKMDKTFSKDKTVRKRNQNQ